MLYQTYQTQYLTNQVENIPQELIDEVKDSLKEVHDLKNNYNNTTQDNHTVLK